MLPLLIAGLGAILVLGSRRPSRSSAARPKRGAGRGRGEGGAPPPSLGSGTVPIIIAKPLKLGEPWSYCKPPQGSPVGTYAAYDGSGTKCIVFWHPNTRATVISRIKSELDKLSKSERDYLCAVDVCEDDPFAIDPVAMCTWMPNADRDAFLAHVIGLLWPNTFQQGAFPPRNTDPYFSKNVWSKVEAIFAYDFCGFNQVD